MVLLGPCLKNLFPFSVLPSPQVTWLSSQLTTDDCDRLAVLDALKLLQMIAMEMANEVRIFLIIVGQSGLELPDDWHGQTAKFLDDQLDIRAEKLSVVKINHCNIVSCVS